MLILRKNVWLVCVVIIALVITAAAALNRRQQSQPAANRPDGANEVQWPVTDHAPPSPSDPNERTERLAKNSRYDKRGPQPIQESSSHYERSWTGHWWRGIPGIPTAQSSVVLVGQITDAHAYLSNDRTGVYSEFTVRVDEVIKNEGPESISAGDSINTERFGGGVRFPSGRIQVHKPRGQGAPRVGRQYVLFLKDIEQGQGLYLVTGYEIRGRRIMPIDGRTVEGGEKTPFDKYKDFDAVAFLAKVRDAVANPSRNGCERGGCD